jgi:hypothetical protein
MLFDASMHFFCVFMSWETQPRVACMPHGQHTTLTACNDIFWSILCPTQMQCNPLAEAYGLVACRCLKLFPNQLSSVQNLSCILSHAFSVHFLYRYHQPNRRRQTHGLGPAVADPRSRTHGLGLTVSDTTGRKNINQ